ncbi:MAG: hypothetical protein ACRCZ3_11175 [Providencia rustigianii]|uniref:hypothetical protein n=1 Tax=Providencia rustigianii TaxID=158850 RepID=UPI003F2DC2C4
MGKRGQRNGNQVKVTVAQAVRDVLLRAMSTGQLVPLTIVAFLIIYIMRIPAESLDKLANRVLDAMIDASIVGYVLFFLTVLAWAWHASVMRKCFSAEAKRIGKEKTEHQQKNTKHSLGTSDK